jgi:hypothetical protein
VKKGTKRCWKSDGGRVRLYTWPRAGLADEFGSDAIPDVAGGEGGHGAAKPERVIHRYRVNSKDYSTSRDLITEGLYDDRPFQSAKTGSNLTLQKDPSELQVLFTTLSFKKVGQA